MANKIFLGMLALLIILGGYVIYTNNQSDGVEEKMGEQVSFNCSPNNSFVAEFSFDMAKLNVVQNGEVKYTLPNIGNEDTPYRFGNSDMEYTFVGEEAIVTDLKTGENKVCSQPLDQNNAPYNFGDSGEGAGANQQDLSITVGENIVKTWKSVDDNKFTRTFGTDGTFTDSYEGGTNTKGNWVVFTKDSGLTTEFPLEDNTVYLRLLTGSAPEDVMHFKILKISSEELELVYMERGGTLKFTAINP